jgi:hypothetical protein
MDKTAFPLSQEAQKNARKFFVISPYVLDSNRSPKAAMPTDCPLRKRGDRPCDIRRHDYRARKTGPCFPLTIVRCHTHDRFFTLYPPGFAPYQRKPVLQLAPEGAPVLHEGADDPLQDYDGTLFEAARDAERGCAWARDSDEEIPDAWWSTQGRHVDRALQLLGLSWQLADRLREAIAVILSVPCMLLRDRSCTTNGGYRRKGKAVCDVLRVLSGGRQRATRLLFCGYVADMWGRPWTWDQNRACLETLPFPETRTLVPP